MEGGGPSVGPMGPEEIDLYGKLVRLAKKVLANVEGDANARWYRASRPG